MIHSNGNLTAKEEKNARVEQTRKTVDFDKLVSIGRELLIAIGEDPEREGVAHTPERWAKWWREFIEYEPGKIETAFTSVSVDQMVVVSGMRVYSLCIPGRQNINAVDGVKRASNIKLGDKLWTLVNGRTEQTTVTDITSHKTRELVQVVTDEGVFMCTPDHPFATPSGWMEAKDLKGMQVEWTAPRSLHRKRFIPTPGYYLGYAIGAVTSDGTVGANYISLVVNELHFAQAFQLSLREAFGVEAKIENVTRPSGYLGRDVDGYRVRIVSSYLADLFRQYTGGDAHHMRQLFPRVVLNDEEIMRGFIDAYVEGDGFRPKDRSKKGQIVISANIPFLQEFSQAVGARFTPTTKQPASKLYIADSWLDKHGFPQEQHETDLIESNWVTVRDVIPLEADGNKPYTVYSFKCEPYPTFLVGGHLSHNCEHHLLPFWCDVSIAYIAKDKVIGLSKFARIAHKYAHQPQIQEQLVAQIADEIERISGSPDVAVVASGVHMCMVMRGIKTEGVMTSSVMRGAFREDGQARMEFFKLVEMNKKE